jgi:hypothetical protein
MQLTLSPEETRELRELLDAALWDLRSEIHHTDSSAFRERLQQRERLLLRLQEQLRADEAQP